MERIRTFLKEATGCVSYLDFRDKAERYWQKETGLSFPDDAWQIIEEEIKSRLGEIIYEKELPVVLTAEEAKDIARALGVDESAESIKEAICTAAVSAVALMEAPIKG